ncbi:MAG: hypothetical protein HF300_15155 [Ignavibacteria bacterium]|jgi:hypothetical protein|nr:hypothetical protein [Ignavibacteria bacterium]MCU7498699.1 hypothetical protein [Ignavibacteria bacterium]MCU7513900.1 hypothetical protein [Ignavibacteria bacterium]MCU7519249.1 hypothetical protein [Ignavibacteria bacterium]MCU7525532.1 hypothetical protein [Ignavibacteria bacterium]
MKYFFLMSFLLVIYINSEAQIGGSYAPSDARSTAMGNTYTASSRGIFAVGKNPANLALTGNNGVEIQTVAIPLPLPSINIGLGTNFMSIKDYNYFFGGVPDPADPSKKVGRLLSPADKEHFADMFKDGGNVFTDISMPLFNLYINAGEKAGAFALTVNDRVSVDFTAPEGLANFAMQGNPEGSVINFSDAKLTAWWLRSYGLSYSRQINDLLTNVFKLPGNMFEQVTFGVTIKYIQGYAYAGTDQFNASIETNDNGIIADAQARGLIATSPNLGITYSFDSLSTKREGKFSAFPTPAGSGVGLDFGLTAKVNDILTLGLALTDAGSVKWKTNAAEYSYTNHIDLTDPTNKDKMDEIGDSSDNYEGRYLSSFSTSLPLALSLGATYQLDKAPFISDFPGSMLLVLEYHQGFNDLPGNSTTPRFGLGFEWKIANGVPFIRSGISAGGRENFNWTFGLGFNGGIFDAAIATRDLNYCFSNSLKRVTLALDTRWKF